MKSLRSMILMLAVAAVPFSATLAFCQQEIAPDHFDGEQPAAKASTHKVPSHHHARGHAKLASKRGKRHSHTAA